MGADLERELRWNPHRIPQTPHLPEALQDIPSLPIALAVRVARHPALPPGAISQAIKDERIGVSDNALGNPSLSIDEQWMYADCRVPSFGRNPALHPDIQAHIMRTWEHGRSSLGQNPNILPEHQEDLAQSGDPNALLALATNPHVHPTTQLTIWRHPETDSSLRSHLLFHANPCPELVDLALKAEGTTLLNHGDAALADMCYNPNVPPEVLDVLFEYRPRLRENLLKNASLPRKHIEEGLQSQHLRRYVARNDALTHEDQKYLLGLDEPDAAVGVLQCTDSHALQQAGLAHAHYDRLVFNPHLRADIAVRLADRLAVTKLGLACIRDLLQHPNYELTLDAPVGFLWVLPAHVLRSLIAYEGVSLEDMKVLGETWNGSIGTLTEAVRLTSR